MNLAFCDYSLLLSTKIILVRKQSQKMATLKGDLNTLSFDGVFLHHYINRSVVMLSLSVALRLLVVCWLSGINSLSFSFDYFQCHYSISFTFFTILIVQFGRTVDGKGALDWQLRRATPTRSLICLPAREGSRRARTSNPLHFVQFPSLSCDVPE